MKALKVSTVAFLLCAAVASADPAPALTTVEAAGEAAIVKGDKAAAEKEAIRVAQRTAVEQVAGTILSAQTITQNSELIRDRISARSDGYVKNTKVLSSKEEGGVVKVTIKVDVGTKDLDRDLQAVQELISKLTSKKLVIVLQEQTIQPPGATGGQDIITNSSVMTTVLTEAFKKDGWTLIDPSYAEGKLNLEQAVGGGRVKTGDLSKADYFLYGKVSLRNLSPEAIFGGSTKGQQNIFPVQGEYDLGIFAADSGLQIARVSDKLVATPKEITLVSYEKTAHNLVRARGGEVVTKIRSGLIDWMKDSEQNGRTLSVSVLGLGNFKDVTSFKQLFKAGTGPVKDVTGGSFADGKAQFDVVYLGTTEQLATHIDSWDTKGKKFDVTGITGNTIQITVKSK